ncbi:amidohydrolase [Aquimarina sp. AU119]|uniref:amidohydrolase family protein n=1 Tax=Aquimarina sp. AU119 TaxID=2108528 RepID=UPI000D68C340|nr:amidohydrolase family protein [Aquimarina sp. AU119]
MKIFDAHFHIINPDFPLVENNGYLPPAFTVENYKQQTKEFNSVGGAIVSGSFQAFDQEYLIHALQKVGNNYVGVANIPFNLADEELRRLQNSNIVAVRFNLKRGGSETIDKLPQLSNKLFDDYGWHTELYVDAKNLKELNPLLSKIQKFSIDHLGLSKEGLPELYAWVEKGVRVKATGFGRVNFNPIPVMRQIYDINPKALLFGTDLPSTRAKIPFSQKDINIIIDNFSMSEQENIFYKNAQQWYNKSGHF